jgi:hypothetical protein
MAEELLASVIEALDFQVASADPRIDRYDADARQVGDLAGRQPDLVVLH